MKWNSGSMRQLLMLMLLIDSCAGNWIMDMLAPFFDLEEIAEQTAKAAAEDGVAAKPVDLTYPLASVEMEVLLQMYHDCRTQKSVAMRTWCTGIYLDEGNSSGTLCPWGVTTHPCTGRILHANTTSEKARTELLWPWEGLHCDLFTNPTTVTHIYLPDESLSCQLATVDLSVMVSLEQLDLSGNHLYGEFPEWLGEMTLLRLLNLKGNELTGNIPPSFAGNDALELINLSVNNLTASTLGFFDAFHRLQNLDLSSNKIELKPPRSLFSSEFLRNINISHNAFHGDLPNLQRFQFLVSFDVSSNFLTGTIPPQLSLWGREDPHDPDENSSLAIVDVSNNLFTGDIPVISNQSALERFDVHANAFNGLIPDFPPSLLVKPADLDENVFLCPMPSALLPNNLACVCGDGYTIKSTGSTVRTPGLGNTDASEVSGQMVLTGEAMDLCVPCPDGWYSNSTTKQKCRSCPPGSAPGATTSRKANYCRLCEPGTFANRSASSSCSLCPRGTFASDIGATSCDPCSPGQYATDQGSLKCATCSVGTFSDSIGASVCMPCPAGTYVNAEGEAECLMCPKDTYQDAVGSMECKPCSVGHVAPHQGHVKCSPCSPGSFYDAATKTCMLCRPGTFAEAAAQTECSKCESGTVTEVFGSTKCLEVADPGWGYLSLEHIATAVKCNPGTFNDGTWRTCQLCSPGMFAADVGSQICSPCAKGTFSSIKGSPNCEKAAPGSFVQFKGAIVAEPCPPNHFAAMNGSTVCSQCQPPSFSFLPGGIECSIAKLGEVYEHAEWLRLALNLARFDHDLLLASGGLVPPPIDVLIQAWTETLSNYSGINCSLHVLQVAQLPDSTQATEIIVAVETTATKIHADDNVENKIGDVIHNAKEAAQGALNDLLDELNGSSGGRERIKSDDEQLADLVQSISFRDALVRQFGRVNLLGGTLPFSMVNVSIVEPPFNSTRAVPCAPGSFFSQAEETERECQLCPVGSFSSTSGALKCELCPRGTFSAEKGVSKCKFCPMGADATQGASSCVECSWLTYECEGFWQDLLVAVCIGAALLRMIYKKIRKLCVGDQAAQRQGESVALMASVRAHGRTFDGVRYAPMGVVSADTMFGDGSGDN